MEPAALSGDPPGGGEGAVLIRQCGKCGAGKVERFFFVARVDTIEAAAKQVPFAGEPGRKWCGA